jgi:hypothetical protein
MYSYGLCYGVGAIDKNIEPFLVFPNLWNEKLSRMEEHLDKLNSLQCRKKTLIFW